ncbi:jg16336 [Pararge aegeria aegeria]|uniref:Jg16336 protein n=1 Tax=Pararge aegeria aegeria TaxID=348720 RepID=A0A8S4RXB7_9NEOP|nr:jg16336 [Pararge aegeria aegeria]
MTIFQYCDMCFSRNKKEQTRKIKQKGLASKVHSTLRANEIQHCVLRERREAAPSRGEGDAAVFSCLWVVGARLSNSNASPVAPTQHYIYQ